MGLAFTKVFSRLFTKREMRILMVGLGEPRPRLGSGKERPSPLTRWPRASGEAARPALSLSLAILRIKAFEGGSAHAQRPVERPAI